MRAAAFFLCSAVFAADPSPEAFVQKVQPFLKTNCAGCHDNAVRTAGVSFQFTGAADALADPALWRRAEQKVRSGEMPPPGRPKLDPAAKEIVLAWMKDAAALPQKAQKLDPGRVTARRLNRAEYNNTVRDLFDLPVRIADDFPADDSGYGFDNIGDVLTLSPMLMENYLRAADKIAAQIIPVGITVKPSVTSYLANTDEQSRRVEYDDPKGYPYWPGAFEAKHFFPVDGEYELVLRVKDRRAKKLPGVPVRFFFDGEEIGRYEIEDGEYIKGTFPERRFVKAGEHTLSADFTRDYVNKEEWNEKLYGKAQYQFERRIFVDQFEVSGPHKFDARGTAAWRRLFVCSEETDGCARQIVSTLARRAYRRPATESEIAHLMKLVKLAREQGDSLQTGIQLAVKAVLVSPQFLFRIERNPGESQRVSDLELAARLSYFLWSSMPDDELLSLAEQHRLRDAEVLQAQVKRMLADPKSNALVKNFAGQWLQLRNLDKINPDPDLFPNFNDHLRQSMIKETELFFEQVMREDRSILEFLDSEYTFLNARLAKHYGVDGVEGREMRRVNLAASGVRGGILTQASVLTISSYPTRTSPVLRGLWVLENILGAPPPPPPPGVPTLDEKKIGLDQPLRKQLEQHRASATCAVCHIKMDAIGFGLENFDPVGNWRTHDGRFPVDSVGVLPGGKSFEGPAGLKKILLEDKDAFARTLSAKMLTFAIGRGMEKFDQPAIDAVAAQVAANGYRFQPLVAGIVESAPFQMRRREEKP